MAPRRLQVTVIGAGECGEELARMARQVGREIARHDAVLLCGGRGGVMSAAAAGATAEGGLAVGVLPGPDARVSPPDSHLDVALFTGIGQARNQILVLSGDAVVGIGGGWGTLSEIALALKHRVPVVLLESWSLRRPDGASEPLLHRAGSPGEAVAAAVAAARWRRGQGPAPWEGAGGAP